ncbi:MAG: S1 RNA-binding domain-containing protein [Planctomycetaceae bacterium]|nr:S1 RNA-binding domain-containing protein [Planctomycetaceae bacterium]
MNVSDGDEYRIAVTKDGLLHEYFLDRPSQLKHVGDIYRGVVSNTEPAIQAVFVDIGYKKNAFLHVSDVIAPYNPRVELSDIYGTDPVEVIPVEEIDMRLVERGQIQKLLIPYALDRTSPVILRSVNSGPDLYYTPDDVRRHLYAVRSACFERNTLYFFNIFVLWKPALAEHFVLLGQIDENLGANRRIDAWALVDWQKRRLADAFRPNPRAARFRL